MFLVMYLREKDPTSMTGQETRVWDAVKDVSAPTFDWLAFQLVRSNEVAIKDVMESLSDVKSTMKSQSVRAIVVMALMQQPRKPTNRILVFVTRSRSQQS